MTQHACVGACKAPRRMTESTLSSVIEVAIDAARLMNVANREGVWGRGLEIDRGGADDGKHALKRD